MKERILLFAALFPLAFAGCGKEPPQAETVETSEPEQAESLRMVMVDGALYCDTGKVSERPRCGMMDGEIASAVEAGTLPTEDGQSNFGMDIGFQYGEPGTIEVHDGEEWAIFARCEDSVRHEERLSEERPTSAPE